MAQIKKFKRILIANRGEIACRLIQACQELGIQAVAVYSDADKGMRHAELADHACALGGESAADSYLNVEKLIKAAKDLKCDAVHPGYGFVSERATAAEAFAAAGIVWIGPTPENIRLLGDKLGAKKILDKYKVPTLPWAEVEIAKPAELKKTAARIGYPVLLKAASGGGGKGMRLVKSEAELLASAETAAREAAASFGDATLLVEKYLMGPRHVEVQVLGDHAGQVIHLGERECSAQRRHQKVLEEAPAPELSEDARAQICEAARSLAEAVGYRNAGTVEFLVDAEENFYFLEVNSRLQVEHPVTELVWGIDLVQAQIRIAEGHGLTTLFGGKTLSARGHAIEARLYAEDPAQGFAPSPGPLLHVEWPSGTGIRIETGVRTGDTVTLNYDAMLAKIIAFGSSREQARERLLWALRHTTIFGVVTNINYLQDILEHKQVIAGKISVNFLQEAFGSWKDAPPEELLAQKEQLLQNSSASITSAAGSTRVPSPWEAR